MPETPADIGRPTDALAAWPGGWYVFENGRVDGPFTADETFRLTPDAEDGKPRLVSRKGFTQWYALKDLSEIFKMTEGLGVKAAATSELTESQLAEARVALAQAKSGSAATGEPASNERPRVQKGHKGSHQKHVARTQTAATAAPVTQGKVSAAPVLATNVASATSSFLGGAAVSEPPSTRTATTARPVGRPLSASAKLQQEYFFLRGRLRLGKLRNPWVTGFLTLPLSLGVLWGRWYAEVSREVAYHAENAGSSPLPPTWLAYVPGAHIFVVLRLARAISAMEAQNRYRSVSPAAAAMFALLPPFAMAYLQDALNRHWMLHVRHALARKKGQDAVEA